MERIAAPRPSKAPFAPRLMGLRTLAFSGILLAMTAGCWPKEGGRCFAENDLRCASAKQAFVCTAGTWKAVACLGTDGCKSEAKQPAVCDETVGKEGAACFLPSVAGAPAFTAESCDETGKQMLSCSSNAPVWKASRTCLGPEGCKATAGAEGPGTAKVACDNSLAAIGDACTDGTSACTADGKSSLVCQQSKFAVRSSCLGDKHCAMRGAGPAKTVLCDASKATVGSACEGAGVACSADGKSVLQCKGTTFALSSACAEGHECHVDGDAETSLKIGCR